MKNISLGWPLAIASVGTLAAVASGAKAAHIAFGAAWAGLSMLHAWSYRKKMKMDLSGAKEFASQKIKENGVLNSMSKTFDLDFIPQSKLDLFIRSVEIASYMPGRVRLYSRSLIGSEPLKAQVISALGEYKELSRVTVNTTTGSILIEYDPKTLRENKELARVESYIASHANKKLG